MQHATQSTSVVSPMSMPPGRQSSRRDTVAVLVVRIPAGDLHVGDPTQDQDGNVRVNVPEVVVVVVVIVAREIVGPIEEPP